MDSTEGHAANVALAYDTAQQEPAGLGPAECLARMQNLRKVWHALSRYRLLMLDCCGDLARI